MARTRYLLAYDISDDRRRGQVHKCVSGFGYPLQYSVFICDMSDIELIALRTELREVIHSTLDRVAFVRLGDPASRGRECFEFMGVHPRLPSSGGATVV